MRVVDWRSHLKPTLVTGGVLLLGFVLSLWRRHGDSLVASLKNTATIADSKTQHAAR